MSETRIVNVDISDISITLAFLINWFFSEYFDFVTMNADLHRDPITVAFSVSSERICCLCVHIVCKNYFHNTTYVRGFDAF